jgi:hypothetical protein
MGMGINESSDVVDVACGENTALIHEDDFPCHELYFVEDVARHDYRVASLTPVSDPIDHFTATYRIQAGKWLVEYEKVWMVSHGLG